MGIIAQRGERPRHIEKSSPQRIERAQRGTEQVRICSGRIIAFNGALRKAEAGPLAGWRTRRRERRSLEPKQSHPQGFWLAATQAHRRYGRPFGLRGSPATINRNFSNSMVLSP